MSMSEVAETVQQAGLYSLAMEHTLFLLSNVDNRRIHSSYIM